MPAKRKDSHTTDDRSELFILEGGSAMGCFTGGTLVHTSEGSLSFEQLANDWVRGITHRGYAYDQHGEMHNVELCNPRITKVTDQLVEVIADTDPIVCTPDHRFLRTDFTYTRADHLGPGDTLWGFGDDLCLAVFTIAEVRPVSAASRVEVYDLTVDNLQNFALAAGPIVHNSANAAAALGDIGD